MAFEVTPDILRQLREAEDDPVAICKLLELTDDDLNALSSMVLSGSEEAAVLQLRDAIRSSSQPPTKPLERVQTSMAVAGADAIAERYQLQTILARSPTALVCRAFDKQTGHKVALKYAVSDNDAARARLRREIECLTRVRGPGIVNLLDHDAETSSPWFVTELLRGETLSARMARVWGRDATNEATTDVIEALTSDTLDPPELDERLDMGYRLAGAGRLRELLVLFWRLCKPLAWIHGAGIVHCNLKPANILIREDGEPVLADFDLAESAEALAQAPGAIGTALYAAPELIEGKPSNARTDLYALGCILYECVTGRPPFVADSIGQLLWQHLHQAPEPPSYFVADVPGALDQLIQRLLAKRPEDRVLHADAVGQILASILAGSSLSVEMMGSTLAIPMALAQPPLVGRDQAMATILEACAHARDVGGQLILVRGESGIGKTFLLNEVSRRARAHGVFVRRGACSPIPLGQGVNCPGIRTPLEPLRPLLEGVADRCRELGRSGTERLLGPLLKLLALYAPKLGALPGAAEYPEPAPLAGPAARERVFLALASVVASFAAEKTPLLLMLDDLQWADDLTLAFLRSLSDSFWAETPIVVVAAAREATLGGARQEAFADMPWTRRIDLGRLDVHQVELMARGMLAASNPLPLKFVELLNSHSDGMPLFVAEYLRAAAVAGLLAPAYDPAAESEAAGVEGTRVPGSIAELVNRRIASLSNEARVVLGAAAVLGREFEYSTLETLRVVRSDLLRPAIDELTARALLHEASAEKYRFVHDMFQQAAYGQLTPQARRELHQKVAMVLVRRFEGARELADQFGAIASHLLAAGDAAEAFAYLEMAGERSLRLSAAVDAISYFNEAIRIAQVLPRGVSEIHWERLNQQLQEAQNLLVDS